MRHRTERWVKLAARGRFTMEAKARIGNVDYYKISAPKIDRSLMSSPLSVGNCTSATLNLSILTDDEIKSTSPVVIMGRLTDGNIYSEWLEFGTFYINQRDTGFEGLVTIDCYDAMLKANQAYLDGSDTSANWPKTMKAVVEEIAYRIGVGIDPRTRINTGTDYVVPYPSGKTMIQVLGDVGACHGGNWIITEENLLRLVPLITAPDETFHVISHDYEKIKTSDGNLLIYKEQEIFNAVLPKPTGKKPESVIPVTHHITDEYGNAVITPEGHYLVWASDGSADAVDGLINVPVVCGQITTGTQITITGVSMGSDSGNTYTAGDESGTVLSIESNPYATQGICDALYTAFNGLVYFPYTATKSLYDPATELGDQVKIGDMVHSVLYTATLNFDLNFRADIGAPNSEELSEEYPYLSEIQKLKQTTEQLNGAITEASKELSEKVSDEALQAEISRATGVETELSTRIGNEETRAKTAENALAQRVKNIEDTSPDAVSSRVSALEKTVSGHGTSISAMEKTVSGHTTDISGIRSAEEKNAENITRLTETVSGHGTTIETMQTDAAALAERVTALEQAVADHETRLSNAEAKVVNLENAVIEIYQRLNTLEGGSTGDTGGSDEST